MARAVVGSTKDLAAAIEDMLGQVTYIEIDVHVLPSGLFAILVGRNDER